MPHYRSCYVRLDAIRWSSLCVGVGGDGAKMGNMTLTTGDAVDHLSHVGAFCTRLLSNGTCLRNPSIGSKIIRHTSYMQSDWLLVNNIDPIQLVNARIESAIYDKAN